MVEQLSDTTAASLKLDAKRHAELKHTRELAQQYSDQYRSLLAGEENNAAAKHGLALAFLEMT